MGLGLGLPARVIDPHAEEARGVTARAHERQPLRQGLVRVRVRVSRRSSWLGLVGLVLELGLGRGQGEGYGC